MASCGKYMLTISLICLIIAECDSSFVKLKCNSHNHGRFGHQSLLECIVTPSKEAEDAKILRVIWMKEGAESALIDTTKLPFEPRFTLAEPEWKKHNRNISMLVMNTKIADIGNYRCTVESDSGDDTVLISLSVSDPYGPPTISFEEKKMILTCKASGGFPEGRIHWFDEHKSNWTRSAKQDAIKTEDGRFNLTSRMELLAGSLMSKYTCAVYNSSGGREGEDHYELLPSVSTHEGSLQTSDLAKKIVIPVVFIGAVIIGLLLRIMGPTITNSVLHNNNVHQLWLDTLYSLFSFSYTSLMAGPTEMS
ncbi:CD276 antigen [Merluccius polli]|uniref:CD276 antigen n=1 Tax=Merluccius polli TaxID=89951 RepID=A0AA47NNZ8_MERPO|nr:CD276 antigen [Merluccius polli]